MQNMQCQRFYRDRGVNGNICMLKRVVTDFNVFDIEIYFFLLFAFLKIKCYLLKRYNLTTS